MLDATTLATLLGTADAATLLFPALGEAAALADADRHFSAAVPRSDPWPLRQEADEGIVGLALREGGIRRDLGLHVRREQPAGDRPGPGDGRGHPARGG